jgi:tubulin-folding cofactor B
VSSLLESLKEPNYVSVEGKQYFECSNKYGAFMRPNKVQVGDYPEDDFSDLDEM